MHVLTALFGHPTDPAAFDDHYRSTHLPLAREVPGVSTMTTRHCASLDADPAPYYFVAEIGFESHEDLVAALQTPQGQAVAGDIANFADGGCSLFVQHD